MVRYFLFCFIILYSSISFAQNKEPVETDTIIVTDTKTKEKGQTIFQDEMQNMNAVSLSDVLSLSPGIMIDEGGARGDTTFRIRGFSSSTIPVIIDGISTLNPYNGQSDSSAMLTGDTESITIQKGYSTMLSGNNGMGGALLLTLAKPKKVFEGFFKTSMEYDDVFDFAAVNNILSLGSKTSKFYIKNTLQYREIDHYLLPKSYKAMQGSIQKDRNRLFSDRTDLKNTLIAGVTPLDGLDIWLAYIYSDSNKGMVSPEVSSVYSLWGWNYDNHHSISLHGKYDKNKIKLNFLAFYDTYDNSMSMYSSLIHVDYNAPYRTSIYDEYAAGFNINGSYEISKAHIIKSAITYRQDNHIGLSEDSLGIEEDINVTENKLSFGVEYNYKPVEKVTLSAALGFDSLIPSNFFSKNNNFNNQLGLSSYNVEVINRFLFAGQLGIFYEFIDNNNLYLTYARRNQFPTMSDRYSTQLGENLPNPNLKPEVADHVELGYKGSLFDMFYIDTALYYSSVSDKMVVMEVPNPVVPTTQVDYLMNLDKVSLYGFEFLSNIYILDYAEIGLNLSVNSYNIDKSQSKADVMTYYPLFSGKGYIKITPCEYIAITPVIEYISERYADIYGIHKLNGYFLAHLNINFLINEHFQIDFSIRNITDELYETVQHYPLKGRSYTLSLTAKI
ncbi:MAG: TonB-dependent receptor [Candidatus Mucispirillum faecigallinarum]|nr:TonB-dependent receptor [Candidatus Mucispirillum faecigallinarum]